MIGIDICLISKLSRSLGNEHFVERVFTTNEREYCKKKANPIKSFAGIYAAKEAIVKALGVGITEFNFHDVEITHSPDGLPQVILCGDATVYAKGMIPHVSISHDGDNAIAVCILGAEK